jgi:hypothetical protein
MKTKLLLLILTIALTGCTDEVAQQKAEKAETEASEAKASLAELSRLVYAQKSAQSTFVFRSNNRLANLEKRVFEGKSANISAVQKGYSIASNEYGSFPISVSEATAYLDGHKITLSIGNPFSASINSGKVIIRYNRREPDAPDESKIKTDEERIKAWQKYSDDYDAWSANTRTAEISIQNEIKGSSWNSFDAILSPSKPEELAYLEVDLKITGISLLIKK